MRIPPILAHEGEPVRVPVQVYEDLAREGERVRDELSLSFGGVTRLAGKLKFDNMIGTIATSRAAIEIAPKTRPGQDWLASVLDLLDDRPVVIFEDAPSTDSAPRERFIDIVARTYSNRLSAALSVEGSITTIEPVFNRSSMLNGRLRVGEWAQRAAYDGHRFPVDHQVLSLENAYSRTLAFAGQLLAPHIDDPRIRRQLLECVETLSGGRDAYAPPANAIGLQLPDQWGAYNPAWTIAQMVLKQHSRFGHQPQPHGMSLVIEPWILLERLLERTVCQLAAQRSTDAAPLRSRPQDTTMFLSGQMGDGARRYLIPDCVLSRNDRPLVNFEAKYRDYSKTRAPLRSESYQAITAGRALGTDLAVLVYPNALTTNVFAVQKQGHLPYSLAVFGLDLFSYRKGRGERERADALHSLLENSLRTYRIPDEGELV